MIRYYHEHPEFTAFTRFDDATGRLEPVARAAFADVLDRPGVRAGRDAAGPATEAYLRRIERPEGTFFVGATPATHTRFPRRVYFQITRACNLACPICFLKAGPGGAAVPRSVAREVADFMGANGLIEVRLTGGEPTTHPAFFDILHDFRDAGVYVSVGTNGVFGRRVRERLAEERNLWLISSIDGNQATHDRGRGPTHDVIMANLRHLKHRNPGLRLRINTVLTKDNLDQIDDLARTCQDLDAESITVIPLRPQVRDPAAKASMVTAAEFSRALDDLVEAKRRHGINFTTTLGAEHADYILKDAIFTKRSSCAAGREGTNLDYDAQRRRFLVYGCSYSPASDPDAAPQLRSPFIAGSFPEDDVGAFLGLWQDDTRWDLFRDLSLKSEDCRACPHLTEGRCTGSCPIQNVDYSRISVDGSVLDQLKEQLRTTAEWYCARHIRPH